MFIWSKWNVRVSEFSDSIWIWSVFKRESKCCALSLEPSRIYLCDPSDNLDLVLLKRFPSLYTSLHSLISSADPAVHCLPTCNVLRNWDFHNNKVISIGGETKKEKPAVTAPASLPNGEDYCQVGPIGGQWRGPGFERQMIADRWTPPSPRRELKGWWGRRECGGSVEQGSTIATRRKTVWHDVSLTQRAPLERGLKLGWCNALPPEWGCFMFHRGGWKGTKEQPI